MRIVICDDHRLIVEGLRAAIARAGHVVEAVALTTTDGVAAVARCRPDLLLLDLSFPDGNSLSAAAEVVARYPETRVVMLTGSDDLGAVRAALDLGITSCLRKDQRIEGILDGLERSARGERVVDDTLAARLTRAGARSELPSAVLELTPRERDVARLLRDGFNTAQMVDRLGIKESTVRRHVQTLLAKLCVHSRIEAVACLKGVRLDTDERGPVDTAVGVPAGIRSVDGAGR
jgi:two-component system nitrate/nitrite response regulator NarL